MLIVKISSPTSLVNLVVNDSLLFPAPLVRRIQITVLVVMHVNLTSVVIWSTLLLALTLILVLPTQSLNMAQYRGINLLLHESGTMIVLTCYTNPLLPALPLQLWVIALFQDTIQKVSNDAKQVVFLTVLWMVIMTLFQSQL